MALTFHVARRQVGIGNVLGLHLRVADKFVRLANAYQSDVMVHCNGVGANGKSILSLLCLAAECGTTLAIEAEGYDAEDSVDALANMISDQQHESEDKDGAGEMTSATEDTTRFSFAPRDAAQSGPRLDKRSNEFV